MQFQKDSGYQFIQQLSPVRGFTAYDLGCGTSYLAVLLSECVGPEEKLSPLHPDDEVKYCTRGVRKREH